MKRFKSVVFILRQTQVLAYLPFATSTKCRSLYLTCLPRRLSLPANNAMLGPGLYTTTLFVPVSDREDTKMGLVQFLGLHFILDRMF